MVLIFDEETVVEGVQTILLPFVIQIFLLYFLSTFALGNTNLQPWLSQALERSI
jgi:hypothetical protein